MNITGYIDLNLHGYDAPVITVYRIFNLERREGELCWVSHQIGNRTKPEGLIHITTFHGHYLGAWRDFCVQITPYDSTFLLKFEPHHIERIWCRDPPGE